MLFGGKSFRTPGLGVAGTSRLGGRTHRRAGASRDRTHGRARASTLFAGDCRRLIHSEFQRLTKTGLGRQPKPGRVGDSDFCEMTYEVTTEVITSAPQ